MVVTPGFRRLFGIYQSPRRRSVFIQVSPCCWTPKMWDSFWNLVAIMYTSWKIGNGICTSGLWWQSLIHQSLRHRSVFTLVPSCCWTPKLWGIFRWSLVAIMLTSWDMHNCICTSGLWWPSLIYHIRLLPTALTMNDMSSMLNDLGNIRVAIGISTIYSLQPYIRCTSG